ncbi:MAG: hypothetical protein CMF61_05480 [Magnetococcales bacterium]|nr:hypothetical protein [Magnetococcales bacterium]
MAEKVDVCIIGGGVVGLFCALELVQSGKVVRVIDKVFNGSSRFNMGEIVLKGLPESIAEFAIYSREKWSHAVESFGKNLGYEERAIARFSLKEKHNEKLKQESLKEQNHGFDVEFVDDLERIKELLGTDRISDSIKAINYGEGEGAIDTAKALDGLRKMIIQAGVRIWGSDSVEKIEHENGRITKVVTDTGEECEAENFIIATGVWSGSILGKIGESLPIRPARVHILQLIPTGSMPHPILNSGEKFGNIVIKSQINGRALVMYTASMDPAQATWSTDQDQDVIHWLRRKAGEMVKSLENAQLRSVNVVTTAITPDKNPYIGKLDNFENAYIAAGMNGKSYAFAAGAAKYLGALIRGEAVEFKEETINAIKPSASRFK